MTLELKTENRKSKEKRQGMLSAVLYGPKTENLSLFVDLKEFKKVWKEAGETGLINLLKSNFDSSLPKLDFDVDVLIHDVQLDPITGEPIHVDFYAVDMTKKITAKIPLDFVGEAPAIKLGGTLVKATHDIEVESLPNDLPSELKVDISKLETFEDKILVKEVLVPSEVEVKSELEDVVAFVEEVKEESFDEVQGETPSLEDIEVTTEKIKEEDDKKEDGEEKKEEKSEK